MEAMADRVGRLRKPAKEAVTNRISERRQGRGPAPGSRIIPRGGLVGQGKRPAPPVWALAGAAPASDESRLGRQSGSAELRIKHLPDVMRRDDVTGYPQ